MPILTSKKLFDFSVCKKVVHFYYEINLPYSSLDFKCENLRELVELTILNKI